jgi:hypothetical protein
MCFYILAGILLMRMSRSVVRVAGVYTQLLRMLFLEGVQLVLEALTNRAYHVVDRWFPKDPNFVQVAIFLWKLIRSEPVNQNSLAVRR